MSNKFKFKSGLKITYFKNINSGYFFEVGGVSFNAPKLVVEFNVEFSDSYEVVLILFRNGCRKIEVSVASSHDEFKALEKWLAECEK